MTKIITCPECGEPDKPVRDDANVCCSNCRVKRWRRMKTFTYTLNCGNKTLDGTTMETKALSREEADLRIEDQLANSKLIGPTFTFVKES